MLMARPQKPFAFPSRLQLKKSVRFLSHSFYLIALIRQRHMKYKKIEFPH